MQSNNNRLTNKPPYSDNVMDVKSMGIGGAKPTFRNIGSAILPCCLSDFNFLSSIYTFMQL